MARYKGSGAEAIYSAARLWRDEALVRDGSVFTTGAPIWTAENLRGIAPRVAKDPLPGQDYRTALAAQLNGAPREQGQLYEEALFFYLLPTSQTSGKTKRDLLKFVAAFASGTATLPPELRGVMDHGLYDPGTQYNISRAEMIKYVFATAARVKELPTSQREALLSDPWEWRRFLFETKIKTVHQMRDGLLHLLFPDSFERIVSAGHKERIIETFGALVRSPNESIDRKILEIREGLRAEYGPEFDFYQPAVYARWFPQAELAATPQVRESEPTDEAAGSGASPQHAYDAVYDRLADALASRKQVVLYGPPGTGKTYVSLRFSTWWLARQLGRGDADSVLTDVTGASVARLDGELTQGGRRTWIVVANPGQWGWDQLPGQGTVEFRYGRLTRNFGLIRKNDLVIGYQSTPDKKVTMLAEVTRGLGPLTNPGANADTGIALRGLQPVRNGPTYDELKAEPRLNASEPLRFRMQGTLFALSEEESSVLFSLIAERDSDAAKIAYRTPEVAPLTRVTFHPSYGYEDFVEGFRPIEVGTGTLSLRMTDGVFKRVCKEALANPKTPFVILIDEINRGNLPRIFGELVTLLEKDKRGLTVVLPQSHEVFAVPSNVYLVGTMNTADRSIRLLDAAIRRRFAFEELMPRPELLRGVMIGDLDLEVFLRELNLRIARSVGREKQIGHSYLLSTSGDAISLTEFSRRFGQEILPLLQEYAYEDYDALAGLIGEQVVDRATKSVRHEVLDDPQRLAAALYNALQAPPAVTMAPA